ncbi:SLAM family member 7 isoform X2 [Erinaceus europaeus]|uniref:SLAM family member 7 isoform X2 n=1 Tax=Erinaceus europaeus TaxID=9365 RepID=A0ABM3XXU6_ERIEU|nr:SLAM family member 7 isoform X2 [Erinaceus europaeus]
MIYTLSCLLLCLLTGLTTSGALKELAGALDGSVTFPLNHLIKKMDTIIWTFNSDTILTIQSNIIDTVIVTHNEKKRVTFLRANYSLILSHLKKNDSGVYCVKIHTSSSSSQFTQKYRLRVYEHLPKPSVILGHQSNENGTCMTNLTCSMEQREEEVTYSWTSLGQMANESYDGSVLLVSWSLEDRDIAYICVARNPVSSNSSSPISAKKLCKGASGDLDSSKVVLMALFLPFFLIGLSFLIVWIRKGRVSEPTVEKKMMDTPRVAPHQDLPFGEISEYDTIPNLQHLHLCLTD